MQRRKFLAALGATAAGGAAAMGTGAFTSVSAERAVSVDVVNDENAYLGLEAIDSRASNGNDGGELEIDFASSSNGANGLNPDSRTAFTDLFRINNLGDDNAVVAVGTSQSTTWKNSGDGDPLLFDSDGLSGYVYAEEQSPSDYGNDGGNSTWDSGETTGLGPAGGFGSLQIDSDGHADLNINSGGGGSSSSDNLAARRTLEPGEYLNVDMTIITDEDGPYFDGNTSIIVLAAEPGSDRAFGATSDGTSVFNL